jgi:hypothetical protein
MKPNKIEEQELVARQEIDETEPECLAISVPEAGASVGLGRSASYEAAKRGDIPTIPFGGRLLVPREKFRRKFE